MYIGCSNYNKVRGECNLDLLIQNADLRGKPPGCPIQNECSRYEPEIRFNRFCQIQSQHNTNGNRISELCEKIDDIEKKYLSLHGEVQDVRDKLDSIYSNHTQLWEDHDLKIRCLLEDKVTLNNFVVFAILGASSLVASLVLIGAVIYG